VLYLLCLTVAQGVSDRGARTRSARAATAAALVAIAAAHGALTPVVLTGLSALALGVLIVHESRLTL
jgi:hypothetical protein